MILNAFSQAIPPSPTLAMSEKAASLTRQGHDVINLSVGEPDLLIPSWIQDAACDAIKKGSHTYTPVAGLGELRKAILTKLASENNLTGYTMDEVIVGCGAKQVIYNAFMVTLQPGHEVIIPAPYWVSYPIMSMMAGGKNVIVPCGENQGFKITAEALEKAITPATRWFILNSPSNPTGAVYHQDELKALGEVLRKFPHVWILCDDIYEHLTYGTFTSLLEVAPFLRDRTLIVNGVSKSFSMTGWRVGYGVGPQALIKGMVGLQSHSTSGASCIAQWAAVAALEEQEKARVCLEERRSIFQERRDYFVKGITSFAPVILPDGAFYAYVNVNNLMAYKSFDTDLHLAHAMLEEARVSCVPGTEFGLSGYVRFSYAISLSLLKEAVDRLTQWSLLC